MSDSHDEWFWSLCAPLYDAMWDGPASKAVGELIATKVSGPTHLLDLGCGTGLVSCAAAVAGAEVVGVDASGAMLQRAIRLGRISRGVTLRDAPSVVPDGWADVVVMTNVLHITSDPEALLALAIRKLRPRGTLVASWPTDSLTPHAMLRNDLRHGRGLLPSGAAHLLRLLVGLVGGFTVAAQLRRTLSVAQLSRRLESIAGLHVDLRLNLADCQEVVLLRKAEVGVVRPPSG